MVANTIVIGFGVGLLAVLLIMRLLKWSIKIIQGVVANSVASVLLLLILQLFGVGIKLTIMKALIMGAFGIPGVIAVFIWDKFLV